MHIGLRLLAARFSQRLRHTPSALELCNCASPATTCQLQRATTANSLMMTTTPRSGGARCAPAAASARRRRTTCWSCAPQLQLSQPLLAMAPEPLLLLALRGQLLLELLLWPRGALRRRRRLCMQALTTARAVSHRWSAVLVVCLPAGRPCLVCGLGAACRVSSTGSRAHALLTPAPLAPAASLPVCRQRYEQRAAAG